MWWDRLEIDPDVPTLGKVSGRIQRSKLGPQHAPSPSGEQLMETFTNVPSVSLADTSMSKTLMSVQLCQSSSFPSVPDATTAEAWTTINIVRERPIGLPSGSSLLLL